jgi:transcriptional regulator with XRE-family HTH domain
VPNAKRKPSKKTLLALGERVRRARKTKGLTQEKLAELIDVHPRMIQKIEAGQTNIVVTTAMRLVRTLGCKWEELMPEE